MIGGPSLKRDGDFPGEKGHAFHGFESQWCFGRDRIGTGQKSNFSLVFVF